ncbi:MULTISPECIES: urea ABC transporter permease subunit UrtB [Methylovorus]|jgi:urea transport system permease protein|uniref:Urea ABC transporter, permease protein UrtB n=1 Tax=Methylovorus glucosotrophus (strain SIP3-4) TaxID=582744 RepID=C6XAL4_METGS|nr:MULTISPECIES: urea ABC transporter permease subunit UrtB [Methylovorus]ACT49946.1 urea ABC transporter, permease protein UrtB [Methylovorus glucosotrophus SIP3-4]ADQ83907.1 urea ABC transporter, permease protein UrtB [Methylovorus sp. MP688]KAF0844711.1 amino acid/amide ABC transporter membrane protein 1 (HAAT family) [Methylovorus glucosotrophus]MCB5207563.1 urea ABC transporter permease subunit UrtB [Methylovorus mays]
MFGYSMAEIGNIMVMQGFAGLSMFSVLLLMALGLAIIFGQMGVINMAHGEFMTIGAYTTVMLSKLAVAYGFVNYYFIFAIIVAFVLAFAIGYLVEFTLIRHLYKRPLDTLLATWGLSLVMQQIFRSSFGAKEVSAELPEWLLGSFQPTPDIDIPINGVFVMGLAAVVTFGVFLFMFRSQWGLRVRATVQNRVMAGAVGINTKKVDRVTFALGCGIAGVAGAAFTTIASTGPTTGTLYIVDSFMVVVFGGAASLFGTIASAFGIAQAQSILQFFMTSSMGKVATLLTIVGILMMRPEGLFASKVRK